MKKIALLAPLAALLTASPITAQEAEKKEYPSPNAIVDAASADEWMKIEASDLLVMDLAPDAAGQDRRVIIQLIPSPFSQGWVSNIRKLAKANWWDGTSINRVQDNYVVQWGDAGYDNPESGETEQKALPEGLETVAESQYLVKTNRKASGDDLPDGFQKDPYSARTFFFEGFPIGVDNSQEISWAVHCYGMVGVGRNYSPDTGSGAELYTVIGHAPRHLDRNIAVVGRIIEGMEHLSSLPRGKGQLGFYEDAGKRVPIKSIRLGNELEQFPQPVFEYLKTDSKTFAKYADARANRRDPFFIKPAGGADICNIPVPVRRVTAD